MMKRNIAIITGATGGMGRACARLLGATRPLVITDVDSKALQRFGKELDAEGYTVSRLVGGDLRDNSVLDKIAELFDGETPFTLVHTAGLSPALAEWEEIMSVNLIATEKLMRVLDQRVCSGSTAVLIASMAGHTARSTPEADSLLAAPLEPNFMGDIGTIILSIAEHGVPAAAAGASYSLSKRAIIGMCERRAVEWGPKGGRIVSISPGLTLTPMGRKEIADTPGARSLLQLAPAGRAGLAADIAAAVRFLVSDEASFVSGCDLKVDGGTFAAMTQVH